MVKSTPWKQTNTPQMTQCKDAGLVAVNANMLKTERMGDTKMMILTFVYVERKQYSAVIT